MATKKANPMLAQVNKQKEAVNDLFNPKYMEISIQDIVVEKQIREEFEDEENRIEDMAEDIRGFGVLQNLIVVPLGNKYLLKAGERRLRGAIEAGLPTVPRVILYGQSEEELFFVQLSENINRKNLTLYEQAKALKKALDVYCKGDAEKLLNKVKRSKTWLSKRMALLDLPEHANRLLKSKTTKDVNFLYEVKSIEQKNPDVARDLVNEHIEKQTKKTKEKNNEPFDNATGGKQKTKASGAGARELVDKYKRRLASADEASSAVSDELFDRIYKDALTGSVPVNLSLEQFNDDENKIMNDALSEFYMRGQNKKIDRVAYCVNGFKTGLFSVKDFRVFFFAAFMCGVDKKELSLSNILESLKSETT